MEYSAKDANKLYFLNQDGTSHFVKKATHVVACVKTTGILDMFAPTAVQLFIIDQPIAILSEWFYAVDAAQKIATQLGNSQELELSFKLEKVSNQCAAMVSFVVNAPFSSLEMIFGEIAAEIFEITVAKNLWKKIFNLEYFTSQI